MEKHVLEHSKIPIGYYIQSGNGIDIYTPDDTLIYAGADDIELIDDTYRIYTAEDDLVEGKGILKVYKDQKENIILFDTQKLLFAQWYDYIKIPIIYPYRKLLNFMLLENGKGYVLGDTQGNIVSQSFESMELDEGVYTDLYEVGREEQYNFINSSGKIVSELWFDFIHPFDRGWAKVEIGESVNYINRLGGMLTSIWFDELIHKNEGYALLRVGDSEIISGNGGNFEYERPLEKNKYFSSEKTFPMYSQDPEFIAFFVYIDSHMAHAYDGAHEGMRDFTLGFSDTLQAFQNIKFVLENYDSHRNVYGFLKEEPFENAYFSKAVSRREALLASALYYLIESSPELQKEYLSEKYRNICLTYMHHFFQHLLQEYMDEGIGAKYEEMYEGGQRDFILGEHLFDVIYWENIYLTYGEDEYTPFCTGGYLECIQEEKK